jgi:nucleoside-diphosphate-sugar epimerase
MDSFGPSKVVGEKTVRAFASHYRADIYALRIGDVIKPQGCADLAGCLDVPPSAAPGAKPRPAIRAGSVICAFRRTVEGSGCAML